MTFREAIISKTPEHTPLKSHSEIVWRKERGSINRQTGGPLRLEITDTEYNFGGSDYVEVVAYDVNQSREVGKGYNLQAEYATISGIFDARKLLEGISKALGATVTYKD